MSAMGKSDIGKSDIRKSDMGKNEMGKNEMDISKKKESKRSITATVMRKEFARFFYDRRLVFSALVLPGLLIFTIYSVMGSAMENVFTVQDGRSPVVLSAGLSESVDGWLSQRGLGAQPLEGEDGQLEEEIEAAKQRIRDEDADVLLVFPDSFDATVEAYSVRSGSPAPNIELYWNSSSTASADSYSRIVAALGEYEESLVNKFDVNRADGDDGQGGVRYDLSTDGGIAARMVSSMLPFLLLLLMHTGCVSVAPESIAGEKERGTIATLLVTPMRRSQLAIGKILSLGVIGFLCGLSSAIGTLFSMSNFIGGVGEEMDVMSIGIFSGVDYALLACVILSTVLVIVSAISILSAFAKSVKEAGLLATPLMVLVMFVGLSAVFGGSANDNPLHFMIPLYNSVQSMMSIFNLSYRASNVAITIASNLAFACVGGWALTRMFNSEKIMFNR